MMVTLYFIKKECLETWRHKKIILISLIFLIFGILSPLSAKLLPEILKMSLDSTLGLPEPTSIDSWTQFYKNISQMGLYIFILIFGGTVSHEITKGTLINLLTKGLSRKIVILSKGIVLYAQWVFSCLLAFGVTLGYTRYYFPDDYSPHPFLAWLPLPIFGLFLVSMLLLTTVVAHRNYSGLLVTFVVMLLMNFLNFFEKAVNYNPISLLTKNLSIIKNSHNFYELWPSMTITVGLTLILSYLAIKLFDHKKF